MTQKRLLALFFAATAALVAIVVLAVASRGPSRSGEPQFEGSLMPAGVKAPDFTNLRDQNGRPISMNEFAGKPMMVTFLYSHCKETCPVEAKVVTQAQQMLGGKVPTLAISVDPRHDTPASARKFNGEQQVDVRWVLGSSDQVQKLWRGYAIQPQTTASEHQARVVLIDKQGYQHVGYPYGQLSADRLAHDIKLLQKQS
ncbi:MAG: SCO family protein [Thermoleophilaceae bacterium]